jgi:hypothetical protein
MKNRLLMLILMISLYGCGQSTNTSSTNTPNTDALNINASNTNTSTSNEPAALDLKKELQIQNQPNTSIIDKLIQSEIVIMCGNLVYELDNGKIRFYEYTSLSPDNNPVFTERNPSIIGPMNFDSNTSTYTWKIEYKILDKNITAVEQLFVNEKELFRKDSMTNQVNVIKCNSLRDFMNQLQDLKKLEKFIENLEK